MKQFSKKLLFADYLIAIMLIIGFFVCVWLNGKYVKETMNLLIQMGCDISNISINVPYPLDGFGIILGVWIAQLGISSGAYYMMSKSDHQIQLPMTLINEMPQDLQDKVDMTQVITSVLSSTNN